MKILIRNTYCEITEAEPFLIEYCKEILSYKNEGAFFGNSAWDGTVYFLNKKNQFPTGLIHKLATALKLKKIPFKLLDAREKPSKQYAFNLKRFKAERPHQGAIRELLKAKQRGVFLAGTGAGKSYMAAVIADELGLNTLIITPDTGLRSQLTADFHDFFDSKIVGNKLSDNKPIIIANIQSIAKADKKLFERFQTLIIDEFHHSGAKSYRKVSQHCLNAFYRYGMTGTFVRPSGDEMEMHGVLSQVIMRVTTSELIRQGFLCKPYVKMIKYDLNKDAYRGMKYQEAYAQLIDDYQIQNMIAEIANNFKDKQTLIVTKRVEHAKVLSEMIEGAVFLSGEMGLDYRDEMKQKFIDKKINCICSTNIFGEGINIPSIDIFINARFEKTEIHTLQGIGRCLRVIAGKTKALVVDFSIFGHKNLRDHSLKREKSYRSETEFDVEIVNDYTKIFSFYDTK